MGRHGAPALFALLLIAGTLSPLIPSAGAAEVDLHRVPAPMASPYGGRTSATESLTNATLESIAKGSKVTGSFPADVDVEDGALIQYRETTTGVDAAIGYRSATGANSSSSLKTRTGNGSAWSGEAEEATAGSPIRAVRMASSPVEATTRIIVTQSDDGQLDAYVCAPTCTVTSNIGQVWTGAPGTPERRFDIAYESLSGEALLVYGVLSTNTTRDIAYRTFIGGIWSVEQYLDDSGHTIDVQYSLIELASETGSDRIGLMGGDDTNNDANAWIWDGTAFGSEVEISATAQNPDREQVAIAWEARSGDLLAVTVAAGSATITSKEFTGAWSAAASFPCGTGNGRWLRLKANPVPTADDMVLALGNDANDLTTCYWTGTAWANFTTHDTGIDSATVRPFDFAWEESGSRGLLVYGTTSGQITYRTFEAPNNWSAATNVAMGGNTHLWVQLRMNPNPFPRTGAPAIVGAVMENGARNLGVVLWNGTALLVAGASAFTADVGSTTDESFDLEYRLTDDDELLVRYDWAGVAAGDSYVLLVKAYRQDEDLAVQVLTSPATWNTRITISATTNTMYTYTLTSAEYNSGAPAVRLVDASGAQGLQSDYWIDLAVVETQSSGTPFPLPLPFNTFLGMGLLTLIVLGLAVVGTIIVIVAVRRRRRHHERRTSNAERGRSRKRSKRESRPKHAPPEDEDEPLAEEEETSSGERGS